MLHKLKRMKKNIWNVPWHGFRRLWSWSNASSILIVIRNDQEELSQDLLLGFHMCGWDFCMSDAWLDDWCVTFWVNVAFSSSRVKIRHFIPSRLDQTPSQYVRNKTLHDAASHPRQTLWWWSMASPHVTKSQTCLAWTNVPVNILINKACAEVFLHHIPK